MSAFETGLHGASLLAGGAVRLLEVDVLTLRRLLEHGDELCVGLAWGRVRDEAQLGVGRALRCSRSDAGGCGECGREDAERDDESDGPGLHADLLTL